MKLTVTGVIPRTLNCYIAIKHSALFEGIADFILPLKQMLAIPFEPKIAGLTLNVHLILEYVAFFTAYRYYVYLRKGSADIISSSNRLSIILGAALGALIGSRVMGFLENPV